MQRFTTQERNELDMVFSVVCAKKSKFREFLRKLFGF